MTQLCIAIGPNLPELYLCQVMDGFACAYRGSNEFWDFMLQTVKGLEDATMDTKIMTMKSVLSLDLRDFDYLAQLRKELFDQSLLEVILS